MSKWSGEKSALVTGAHRGLGRATAVRLAAEGYLVWLGVRNEADASDLVAEIEQAGHRAIPIRLDVTDPAMIAAAARLIEDRQGSLAILVNNAGVMLDGGWLGNTATTIQSDILRKTFEVNLFGAVAVTQAMWPLLSKSGHANVVNLSSRMGSNTLHADPEGPLAGAKPFAYDASKAALNALTTHLAEAGRPLGIQVNSAHPGWVRTGLGTEYADLSLEEGVGTIVELALLPPNSRTAVSSTPAPQFPGRKERVLACHKAHGSSVGPLRGPRASRKRSSARARAGPAAHRE